MSPEMPGGRFCARDAQRIVARVPRQALEARADAIVETRYPAIWRAATMGKGKLVGVIPAGLAQDLREAVLTSLRIDGYIVRDGPDGTTIAWTVGPVSERSA